MIHNPLHAFILCNGEPPTRSQARRLLAGSGSIVAADGGANAAAGLGIRPDVIIGDLDSISASTRKRFASTLILRIGRQDNTDIEKALDFVLAQGIRRITLAGTAGRRVDFTLANFSVLWKYSRRANLQVVGKGWRAYPVWKAFTGRARRGTTVSIIPFGVCRGITLTGLRYPLRNAAMRVGDVGVSNVVVQSPFSVRVRRGKLLVFIIDDYLLGDSNA